MANAQQKKAPKKQSKGSAVKPEVLPQGSKQVSVFTMDGTAHTEFSTVQNIYYSKEIIEKTTSEFNIEKLNEKFSEGKDSFLAEGKRQINELWHGIEALTVHNTMFVVLFLLSIGEILNEVRAKLTRSEFVAWRRSFFSHKQERYLQQAQQLAKMGDFAKKYASMGKKRLLILDKLRKDENKESFEELFEDHPIPEEVEESFLAKEQIQENPFPDSTEDFEGELLKEHVDAKITLERLKKAGIDFASFDQAYLIAAYNRNPIPVKNAVKVATWVNAKGSEENKKKWFDILVLNKMMFPEHQSRERSIRESLNSILAEFVDCCKKSDFTDQEWIALQKPLLDKDIILQSMEYIRKVGDLLGIKEETVSK